MAHKRHKLKILFLYGCLGFVLCLSGATASSVHAETLASAVDHGRWASTLLSNPNAPLDAGYTVDTDNRGQTRIRVTGSGATVTLATIQAGLGAPYANLLQNLGNGVWLLNANLFIDAGVTLNLGVQSGANELRMRSEALVQAMGKSAAQVVTEPDGQQAVLAINYSSFVYLATYNGVINLDGIKVYSWDPTVGAVDQDISNGRAYLLAKYNAALNIRNSDIGYLGSADGESYGVSWRDVNATTAPSVLLSRVTGQVLNSKFHHLYYGIYTFQASNMVFQTNEFYENIRYGFDPHDFTHDVLVENNSSHNNGAHGYIISRGCNNFIFRNNKAYDNFDPGSNQAQGFMLDPGSPNSSDPQAPSHHNLLENNEAYGNEGHGLRILGSIQNQILNNNFHNNQQGIVVDLNSPDNLIDHNSLNQNSLYGLSIRETSDRTTATYNTTNSNGNHGIYVRSSNNGISHNSATTNQGAGLALLPATGAGALASNQILTNTLTNNLGYGLDLRGVTHALVQGNLTENNAGAGIYVANSSTQNSLMQNTVRSNQNYGILASGSQTFGNTWSENQIYANGSAGILLTSGANLNLAAPQLLSVTSNTLAGVTNATVTVEIYADNSTQGQFFLGRTISAADGSFSFALPGALLASNLTGLIIDAQGNASSFSPALNNPNVSTATTTSTPTDTSTATSTATPTTASTAISTATPTTTSTAISTATPTTTSTATSTATPTATSIPGITATPTVTSLPTLTPTSTSTPSPTLTVPPGSTPTATITPTPTATATVPADATSTATATATGTVSPMPPATLTAEPTFPPGGTNANNHLFLPFIER
ncbi:hypothetical protein BH10CHL1_BH10CHL1_44190 [soil metagenome]